MGKANPNSALRTGPTVTVFTDASGTIAAGGVAQPLLTVEADASYVLIQNHDDADDLWIGICGATATEGQPSIRLKPGVAWQPGDALPLGKISIIGPTPGQAFTAKVA